MFAGSTYDEAAARWHAVAATRELTLVTANVADVRRFRGLTVVDWSRA
jgi:hypothetical protein